MKTEAIIFDLGGVLLNIDYHLTINAFKKIGYADFDALYSQAGQSHLFDELETGKIKGAEFISRLKALSPDPEVSNEDIITAWNAMLLDFPADRIELVKELGKSYPLFLLSNTNEIHMEAFNKILKRDIGLSNLEPLFEKTYYSHMIGKRKPDIGTYKYVIDQNNLKAENCIFIDDSIQNIIGAEKAGLKCLHKTADVSLHALLKY